MAYEPTDLGDAIWERFSREIYTATEGTVYGPQLAAAVKGARVVAEPMLGALLRIVNEYEGRRHDRCTTGEGHADAVEYARDALQRALASVGRNPKGQDRETGLGRNDEHAVGATGAETPNPRSTPETGLVEALTSVRKRLVAVADHQCTKRGDYLFKGHPDAWIADSINEIDTALSNVSRLEDN